MAPAAVADIIFRQAALKRVGDTFAASPDPVFGGLVGRVFEDPACSRPWALIEDALPVLEPVDEASLGRALRALEHDMDPDLSLLGWFRGHREAGVYLTPEEARLHEERLPHPWGVALIVSGSPGRTVGGTFQRTVPEGLSRSVYTAFYELVEPSSRFGGPTRRTFAGWLNYETETKVVRAGQGPLSRDLPEASARTDSGSERTGVARSGHSAGRPGIDLAAPPGILDRTSPVLPDDEPTAPPDDEPPGPPANEPPEPPSNEPSPAPVRAPAPTAGGPRAGAGRGPGAPEGMPEDAPDQEAEWKKIQIQRSLMAVGRSLNAETIGALGEPASPPPLLEPDEPVAELREPDRSGRTEPRAAPRADDPEVTPVRPGPGTRKDPLRSGPVAGDAAPDPAPLDHDLVGPNDSSPRVARPLPAFVGRARRRPRLPTGRILAATAGLILLAAAGFFGSRSMRGGTTDAADTGEGSASAAGITMTPGVAGIGEERETGIRGGAPAERDGAGSESPDGGAFPSGDGGADSSTPSGAGDGGDGAPQTVGEGDGIVASPTLDGLAMEEPEVAAYANALAIFRREADRYEELRREFDDGLGSCNPLNLSYRGVREAHQRLERRFAEVRPPVADSIRRAFEGAGRLFAMMRTHYELTDCPMPVETSPTPD